MTVWFNVSVHDGFYLFNIKRINVTKQVTQSSTFCAFLQALGSGRQVCSLRTDFCVNLPALHPQLVDLRLGNVSPFLGLLQLVLELAEFGEISVGLFLLRMKL